MPIGLMVRDADRGGQRTFEAFANGDGPPLGRELELAELLSFLKAEGIRNVVWITADVHYAAAHHYDPERAAFTDFHPVLGVRRRAAQCRHVRAGAARSDLRARGAVSERGRPA